MNTPNVLLLPFHFFAQNDFHGFPPPPLGQSPSALVQHSGSRNGVANYSPWAKSSPPPVSVNKALLEHSHTVIYILSMAAFPLQWQSWVAMTETIWSMKPKIFTIWSFTGKVCWPRSRIISHQQILPKFLFIVPLMKFLLVWVFRWAHFLYILHPPSQVWKAYFTPPWTCPSSKTQPKLHLSVRPAASIPCISGCFSSGLSLCINCRNLQGAPLQISSTYTMGFSRALAWFPSQRKANANYLALHSKHKSLAA